MWQMFTNNRLFFIATVDVKIVIVFKENHGNSSSLYTCTINTELRGAVGILMVNVPYKTFRWKCNWNLQGLGFLDCMKRKHCLT